MIEIIEEEERKITQSPTYTIPVKGSTNINQISNNGEELRSEELEKKG